MPNFDDPVDTVFKAFVPSQILERLSAEDTQERPGIPFVWLLSYRAQGALQNIRYMENGVRHCSLNFPVRVFLSSWTDAILVSFVPLEAVRDPHIQEWYVTFYEVEVEEAKRRLSAFPRFPYDGRDADAVRAQMIAGGDIQALLKRSAEKLRALGVPIESGALQRSA